MHVKRNTQLEGLRGLAMLLVVCFHYFCMYVKIYFQDEPTVLLMNHWGAFGVTIFFLLSGYFIPSLDRENTGGIKFLLKRILNLWPTYFIAVTTIFIVTSIFILPGRSVEPIDYLLNIFWINGYIGTSYVDGAHWYLTVLVGCMLCYSLILKVNSQYRTVVYGVWLGLDILLFYIKAIDHRILHLALSGLFQLIGGKYVALILFGTSLAALHKKLHVKENIILLVLSVTGIFLLLGIPQCVMLALAVILFELCRNSQLKLLEGKFFVWLGSISYSVYVIHQNIGYVFMYYISPEKSSVLLSIIGIVCIILVGWCFHKICKKNVTDKLLLLIDKIVK